MSLVSAAVTSKSGIVRALRSLRVNPSPPPRSAPWASLPKEACRFGSVPCVLSCLASCLRQVVPQSTKPAAEQVVRLFGRVRSLKKIVTAMSMAMLPVCNVFLILFLLISLGGVPPGGSVPWACRVAFRVVARFVCFRVAELCPAMLMGAPAICGREHLRKRQGE